MASSTGEISRRLSVPYLSKVSTAEALSLHEGSQNLKQDSIVAAAVDGHFPAHVHFIADLGSPYTYLSIEVSRYTGKIEKLYE